MKKVILIGLCILLLTGATYKLNLWSLLNEYEEVCFLNETWVNTTKYCDGDLNNFTLDNITFHESCLTWGGDGYSELLS